MSSRTLERRSGKNLMPSKADQREYLKRIRQAADEKGDIVAMGVLLALSRVDDLLKNSTEIAQHIDGGIFNLAGHGGWSADESYTQKNILAAIRQNNPDSEQLPENK